MGVYSEGYAVPLVVMGTEACVRGGESEKGYVVIRGALWETSLGGCVTWVTSEEVDNTETSSEPSGRYRDGLGGRGVTREDLGVGLVVDE
eukprot:4180684-Ditylum_brightwellii.AAC.1